VRELDEREGDPDGPGRKARFTASISNVYDRATGTVYIKGSFQAAGKKRDCYSSLTWRYPK
jgi:hypothetical protein